MLCIGLTGGIGSGKSTATHIFSSFGIPIIDADVIARELMTPQQAAFDEIVRHFGKYILDENQHINRRILKQIIFDQPQEKIWLEHLLHPLIISKILRQKHEISAPYCIVSAPLLMEAEIEDTLVDRILVIDATPGIQVERTKARDNIDEKQIVQIIKSQIPREQRLEKADDVIENNGDLNTLRQQIKKLHQMYLTLSQQQEN
ncbi:MAG: coaE [Gammaproteobacteria bacterium]|jgi:dephospho-CoA kinase|nr:coaE [Gammaproteobacteria bacterium]